MMKSVLFRLLIILVSVALTLLGLELVLRAFVQVTDNLEYESLDRIGLRLKPGQRGHYLASALDGGPPVRGTFRVNRAGFNSPVEFDATRRPDSYRIVVVGDSFVEALQVDSDEAFPYVLERSLRATGVDAEVYSFGISGYGTAQVLSLLENVALQYSPDFVVYLFVPNDVEDSSPWRGRAPWTQQFDLGENGELVALPFSEYRLSSYRKLIKKSALFRYLFYQNHWMGRIRSRMANGGWNSDDRTGAGEDAENRAWTIVEKLLDRMDDNLRTAGVPWLLVWQADVNPAYSLDRRSNLEEIVAKHDLPYLDPTPSFVNDYLDRRRALTIKGDGHWSRDGHRVAGEALAIWLHQTEHLPQDSQQPR